MSSDFGKLFCSYSMDEFTPKSTLMPNHQILFCLGILFNRSTVQLFNRRYWKSTSYVQSVEQLNA